MSNTEEVRKQLDAADRASYTRLIEELDRIPDRSGGAVASGAKHIEIERNGVRGLPPELPTGTTGHAGKRTETPAEREARIARSSSAALRLVLIVLLLIGMALAGGLYGGWLIHGSSARDFEKALTDAHSRCKEQDGNWRESLEYFSCEVDQKAGTE